MPDPGNFVYDLGVVGAGILGLAHAFAAARQGKRVVVFDRTAHAVGASVRNFGFVTVTGPQARDCWRRARRSRDIWVEVAPQAGISVEHSGLCLLARREEAAAVLEAFMATEMADGCSLLSRAELRHRAPLLAERPVTAALWSPHEIRVDSRLAIARLAAWLEEAHGVTIIRDAHVRAVAPPVIDTSAGRFEAGVCIVCAGEELKALFPDRIAAYGLAYCTLHMLRLAPQPPECRLPAAVMTDLSLVRYLGYAELPQAQALRTRLEAEQPEALRHGIHLIVVQNADCSLVVGDSHRNDAAPTPFADDAIDAIILDELRAALAVPETRVAERWLGVYPHTPERLMLIDRPADDVRVVIVTSGTGASTAFAIAEEVVDELFG